MSYTGEQSSINATTSVEATFDQHSAPLADNVKTALDAYFSDLAGHSPSDLYRMVINEVEKPLLQSVMTTYNGNQSRAAKVLGINRSTLRKKLQQFNIS